MSAQGSVRSQAKLIVSLLPGLHLRKLQRLMGVSFTTTRYHVESLEKNGELVRAKDGGYDRLYPAGTNVEMMPIYAAFQSETSRRVLKVLSEDKSGLTTGELSQRLRLPSSTVSECATHLAVVQLVKKSLKADGRFVYEVEDAEAASQLLALFRKNMLTLASESFIDLWDL